MKAVMLFSVSFTIGGLAHVAYDFDPYFALGVGVGFVLAFVVALVVLVGLVEKGLSL